MVDPLGIALKPGQILRDTYQVVEQIGAGAMGAIYRVEELKNGAQWALKVPKTGLPPEEYSTIINLYRSEAEILAKLSHPNLPQVREHFPYPGGHCLVFELLTGGSLDQHLARAQASSQQLEVAQVVGWGVQIARALEYLHSRQPPVILKDLKPENVMLAGDGSVRLIDFGIAKEHNSSGGHTVAIGTEAYAAPDHYGLMGRTDERTDLFTFGATLYHLLTGRTQRETRRSSSKRYPNSAVQALFPGPPQPAHELNVQVPPELSAIAQRCLEIDPAQRYQSASEVRAALEALIGDTAAAPNERARPWQALRQSLEKLQRTIPPSLRTSMQGLPKTLAPTLRESWQQARALLDQMVSGVHAPVAVPATPRPA
ncbi:MAG: serine/threonine protein kinase, partial [Deinococcus sp.]|nr:serine/threonine protein kinase [Deinococcus sp.]